MEAPPHWRCTGIYGIHSSFEVFPAKEIKKKHLLSSYTYTICIWTHLPPLLAHQITLKLLLLFRLDFLPDVAKTQLITLFWALWFRRDLITQYSSHWVPYIASAWRHSLWGCGCHDNLLQTHNLSLPPICGADVHIILMRCYYIEHLGTPISLRSLPRFWFRTTKSEIWSRFLFCFLYLNVASLAA